MDGRGFAASIHSGEIERKGLRTVTSNSPIEAEAYFLKEGINWHAEEYLDLEEVVTYLLK
ncbi:hypothetical protein ABIE66_000674 [Peribacillus sp. B2I2]|uniref:hypothetical protein n=1 Tax=Peribacillus sp. B2I2 TaxID=3156468 RepID=UPI003511F2DC